MLLLLIVSAAAVFLWLCSFKEKLKYGTFGALILSAVFIACGVLSVMLFAVIEAGPSAWGNTSLFGSILILPLFFLIGALIFKRDIRTVFDVFTISVVITLFFLRINCLIAGCCVGRHIGELSFRYPIREIEIIYYFMFFDIEGIRVLKNKTRGEVFPLFALTYGVLRFILQFMRQDYTVALGMIHVSHIWAVMSIVLGTVILIALIRADNHRKEGKR